MVKPAFGSKGKGVPKRIFVNPNFTKERTICTPTTQFSAIAELRNDVTPILGHLIWFCMGRPDCGVYVPLYVETIDFGQEFQNFPGITDPVKALQYHFNEPEGAYQYNSSKYFWICNDLENLTDMFYENCIDTVASAWSTFEQNVTNLQDDVEDTVERLMKRDVNNAKLYLNQHSNFMINEAKSRTLMLIKKIKSDYYR
ncbi:hypothetical protein DRQ07_01820 [candidate division KSB1 bacterium]|nr:MAG: hypothetical protein DRQ07_01820 [candidate division KSB1 bacterium]